MGWSFLTQLLDELSTHSTFVGKIWLTLLIVFRIVLTAVGAESIYSDEQSNFVCNTLQPGCHNVCYDAFAPLSQIRFWVFQVIMITTPTIMYLGFAAHKIARMNDEDYRPRSSKRVPLISRGANQDYEATEGTRKGDTMVLEEIAAGKEKESRKHDGRRRIKRDGLMKAYVLQLLSRAVFEVSFLVGQYLLYGLKVAHLYTCERSPCPNTVDCFVSRPTEKTIFLFIMYAVSALCLLVTVLEILHLGISGLRDCFRQPHPRPCPQPRPRHRPRPQPHLHPRSRCHPRSRPNPPTPHHSTLTSQRSSIRRQLPAPLHDHGALNKKPWRKTGFRANLGDSSSSSGPEWQDQNPPAFGQEKQRANGLWI